MISFNSNEIPSTRPFSLSTIGGPYVLSQACASGLPASFVNASQILCGVSELDQFGSC